MEEYLTVKELSDKIKFSRQSLYNLIHRGAFVLGKHYLKPTPKKVLFKWSEIQKWIGEEPGQDLAEPASVMRHLDEPSPAAPMSLINI